MVWAHGDDRAASGAAADRRGAKPPVLQRRTVAFVAVLVVIALGYGGLAPFRFDGHRALQWNPCWERPGPGDTAANVLIYMPIGACLRLLLRRRGSNRLWEVLGALGLAAGVSYFTEVLQGLIPVRVSSWTDVTLNCSGALLGVACAPLVQRWLRNGHALMYVRLRSMPISIAAAALTACLCAYALSPPDFYPSPHHAQEAWHRLSAHLWDWTQWPPVRLLAGTGRLGALDKLAAGGAFGILAFVLVLARREAGQSAAGAAAHAFSRALALATALEGVQFFTLSHVADLQDVGWSACCISAGALFGWMVLAKWPQIHRQPLQILRGLVIALTLALLIWALAAARAAPAGMRSFRISWLPMMGNFRRSWNSLLGDYTAGLLMYTFVCLLVVLWYRAARRRPWTVLILTLSESCAVCVGLLALARRQPFDTAQFALALVGAMVAIRLDGAVFGKRANASHTATTF